MPVTGSAEPAPPTPTAGWAADRVGALPLRADLVGQQPYGAPQLDVPVRLNVNENPYPPSPELVAALADAVRGVAGQLNRYPDRDALDLRADLAGYLAGAEGVALSGAQVWAANGSNELMLQLLTAFGGPGRRALGFAPTYSMYPEYCRDTFTDWLTVPRRDDFTLDMPAALRALDEHAPTVVLVASPNNPTGTALPVDQLRALLAAAPGLVVVDEAYAEFRRPGTPSALTLLADHPRLVVTRTMSKAFAFAGGRVGYLAAAPAVVDALRVVRLPYHLSTLTQTAARVALAHSDQLLARVADLREQRDALVAWLRGRGWTVPDSDANFAFVGRFPDRHTVWERLVARGVLVRETGPDGWLRVSVGTPAEMAGFRDAFTAVTSALTEETA